MHELLQPADVAPHEAALVCRAYLRRRRAWSLGLALPSSTDVDNFAAFGAFDVLARELERSADPRTALEELARELDACLGERPTTLLGIPLALTVRRHGIPPFLLRGPIQARLRHLDVHAYATREELVAFLRRLVHPTGRVLLRLLGRANERTEVLADALANGVQLAAWLADLRAVWARGHLPLPMEELARFGVDLKQVEEARHDDAFRRLMTHQIARAREWLARGWPLTQELGPWHGRRLAFFLRWHAAGLSAIEAGDLDVLRRRPRSGLLRLLACLSVSAATTRSPELDAWG